MVTKMEKRSATATVPANEVVKTNVVEGEIIAKSPFNDDPKAERESAKIGLELINKAGISAEMALKDARNAAGYALFHAAKFGNCDLLSKLYVKLMAVNSAMAVSMVYFIRRVNLEFRQDGEIAGEDEKGNTIWEPRPTTIVQFLSNPKNSSGPTQDHFNWNPKGRGKNPDAAVKSMVRQARIDMIEAGLEALQSITWMTQKQAQELSKPLKDENFEKRLEKLIKDWAGLAGTTKEKSFFTMLARSAGLKIESAIAATYEETHKKPAAAENGNELIKSNTTEETAKAA